MSDPFITYASASLPNFNIPTAHTHTPLQLLNLE